MPVVPVIPVPRTWAAGPVKVPALRQDLSAAVQLLRAPPVFAGVQGTAQSIPNNAAAPYTAVSIDTENWDSVNGHRNAPADNAKYFAIVPGYYLAEAAAPLAYTGGAGVMSSLIGFSSAGGAVTAYGGGLIPNAGAASRAAMPRACKLLRLVNTGPIAGTGVDYVQPIAWQTSGAAQNLQVTPAQPQFTVTWVAALSGTQPLPVPANPAWPVPPGYVTSAFLNANIRDAIRFLIYPPVMEARYNAGTATLASQVGVPAVGITIPLDTTDAGFDTYAAFNTTTHTWTAPVAGVYYCYGQVAITAALTTNAMAAGLTVTSANYNGGTQVTLWEAPVTAPAISGSAVATVRRRLRLNAGDTILLAGHQNDSGSNAATLQAGTWNSRLAIIWRSA